MFLVKLKFAKFWMNMLLVLAVAALFACVAVIVFMVVEFLITSKLWPVAIIIVGVLGIVYGAVHVTRWADNLVQADRREKMKK